MDPVVFEQISTKIEELKALLDAANAQALSVKEIRGKQRLSAKLAEKIGSTLQTLQVSKPTLYADKIDRKQLGDLKTTYDAIPDFVREIKTCIKKAEGWRISTGQNLNAIMLRLYRLLGADVPDNADLRPLFDSLAVVFKTGKRKPKNGNNDDASSNDNASNASNDDAEPTN